MHSTCQTLGLAAAIPANCSKSLNNNELWLLVKAGVRGGTTMFVLCPSVSFRYSERSKVLRFAEWVNTAAS